jgi:hypothetical protein
MTLYFIEKCQLCDTISKFLRSTLTACCLFLANCLLGEGECYLELKSNYKFDQEEFKNCLGYVIFVLKNPHYNNLGAVRRKFSAAKFHGVSSMKFENLSVAYEKLNRFIGEVGSNGAGDV